MNLCSHCGASSTARLCDACEVVERIAVAIRAVRNVPGVGDPSTWDMAPEASRAAYRREARAAITALNPEAKEAT